MPPRPKITISKETTYVTEPLRADGYVDYLAAINRRCSEGVTPKNNAAIPFWQAFGPKEIDKEIRGRYFKLLGIPELPEEGPYLVSFDEYLPLYKGWKQPGGDTPEDNAWFHDVSEQYGQAKSGPWSKEEFPVVAGLLEKNDSPLQTLVDGLRRPRLYSPVVASGDAGLFNLLPMMASPREAARQLTARAMLRLHEGRVAEAWQDIFACHRLARLVGQRPLLVDGLVAVAYEGIACSATVAFAQQGNLTAEQARQSLDDLQRLPKKWTFREKLDYGERVWLLGTILMMANGAYQEHQVEFDDPVMADLFAELRKAQEPWQKARKRLISDPGLNWDQALRHFNAWYDRIVAAYGKPTYAERREASDATTSQLRQLSDQVLKHTPETNPPQPQMLLMTIAEQFAILELGECAPSISTGALIEAKSQARFGLARLVLALAGFRHDHGSSPKRLTDLSPKYIAEVPNDPFADAELIYKPTADGYLLYSVGPNGKDDGGRNYVQEHADDDSEDESATEEEESWDDIAIRMPPKKAEK